MKPIDSRLLRFTTTTRRFLVASTTMGVVAAAAVIAQATALAHIIVLGTRGQSSRMAVVALAAAIAIRVILQWAIERAAVRASSAAKHELREAVLEKLGRQTAQRTSGEIAVVVSRGIDALDGFFAKYLTQLVLAAVVPFMMIAWMAHSDWKSAAAVAVTLPLIPLFMALVGRMTEATMQRQVQLIAGLGGHFIDLLRGLTTLRVFNKAEAQAQGIEAVGDELRKTTMSGLRIAFLSSFVLELIATIGVALVAVSVGFRLVSGSIDFESAFVVLLLAPEVYIPLRQVGAQYHANAEGVAAANVMFELLEDESGIAGSPPERSQNTAPSTSIFPIVVTGATVAYPQRNGPALAPISFRVDAGDRVALCGPSGSGKSTLLAALAAMTPLTGGSITVDDRNLRTLDAEWWRAQCAWISQRPHLFAMSVFDNVHLARPTATEAEVHAAMEAAGVYSFADVSERGTATMLGERGIGLSSGQRQRVGIARAFLRDAPVILADEPTEHLDAETESMIVDALDRLARGRTLIFVAHRPALRRLATKQIDVAPGLIGSSS